jgi:uncharacterized membrane protein YvbJ
MFCPKCGRTISDQSDFCMYCGERIRTHQYTSNDTIFNHTEPENDFIILNCHSCGGRLSVNKNV